MSLLVSFILVLAALVIGEIISTKTKAIIPSVFITAVLFLVGYWTIFPADIIAKAGFSTNIIYLSMYFLITHMGTMLSVRELIAQWKTLVISIFGICGICIGTLLLGQLFFSWDMLVVATPPLTGGVVASIIMSEAAKAKGLDRKTLIFKHALRNALIPVITILGPILVNLMTGTMVVEKICSVPGLGKLLINSILSNDYNIILACSFLYAAMYIFMMLIIDISYGIIDPRIRLGKDD